MKGMKQLIWLVAVAGIVGGLINLVPLFVDSHWYKALNWLLHGLVPVIYGFYILVSRNEKPIVGIVQGWINVIMGISTVVLASSSYYRAMSLGVFNWLSGAILIISGVYVLLVMVKQYEQSIIP